MESVIKKKKTLHPSEPVRYFKQLNWWYVLIIFFVNATFQLAQTSFGAAKYVGGIILVASLFMMDRDDYIYLFIALITANTFITFTFGGFSVSILNVVTIFYFIRKYFTDNDAKKITLDRRLILPCLILILYNLHFALGGSAEIRSVLLAVKQFFFFFYIVDVFAAFKDKEDAKDRFTKIQIYYVLGILLAVVCSIILNPEYSLESGRMSLAYRSGTNSLGVLVAYTAGLLMINIIKNKNKKEMIIIAVALVALVAIGFATMSRACLFSLVIALVATLGYGIFQPRTRGSTIIFILIAGAVTLLLLTVGKESTFYSNILDTIDRVVNPKNDDISNGRFELWTYYINELTENPNYMMFGIGGEILGDARPHNMFLEVWADYGAFGFGIVVWVYVAMARIIREKVRSFGFTKIKLLGFLPFLLVFTLGMTTHSILNTISTTNFCIGIAMIYMYGSDMESEDIENSVDNIGKSKSRLLKRHEKNKRFGRMDLRNGRSFNRI